MNFASILSATHAAIVDGKDTTQAARVAFPVLAKGSATIEDLLRMEREGTAVTRAVAAGQTTIAAGLRAHLKAQGYDVTDRSVVRNALRVLVWADEGHKEPMAKPDDKASLVIYNAVSQRLSRISRAVVGADATMAERTRAQVRVPRNVQSTIEALIAEHGVAVLREALKRAK